MLIDGNGRALKLSTTTTTFDPRLVRMLIALEDVLRQNGLSLFCTKCHRLGLPDGVKADNDPASDIFTLSCGCARREFHKPTGKETVHVH
jgi:hypothetical protein